MFEENKHEDEQKTEKLLTSFLLENTT